MNKTMKEHIACVKELLSTKKDFYEAGDYFSKYLGMDEAFIRMGNATENPLLKEALTKLVERINKAPTEFTLLLHEVPETTLIHGSLIFAGQFAAVCYFTDIDIGMVIHPNLMTGQTSVYRISLIKTNHEVTIVQPNTKTVQ